MSNKLQVQENRAIRAEARLKRAQNDARESVVTGGAYGAGAAALVGVAKGKAPDIFNLSMIPGPLTLRHVAAGGAIVMATRAKTLPELMKYAFIATAVGAPAIEDAAEAAVGGGSLAGALFS